jgi:hypothetical protein
LTKRNKHAILEITQTFLPMLYCICSFARSVYFILLISFLTTTAFTSAAQKYKTGQRVELNVDDKGVWYKGYVKEVQGFENGTGSYLVHLDQGVPQYGGGNEFSVTNRYFGMMRPE